MGAIIGREVHGGYGDHESWYRITERRADVFFNGGEAVRFDYANRMALVAVPFSSASDSLFPRVTDAAGRNVAVATRVLHSAFSASIVCGYPQKQYGMC